MYNDDTPCRCIESWQMFPPGRSVWCNKNGPTVRPASLMGGHLCCRTDMCNGLLKPAIVDYSNYPQSIFDKGSGLSRRFFVVTFMVYCYSIMFFFLNYSFCITNIQFNGLCITFFKWKCVFSFFFFLILTRFCCIFLTILDLY